MNDKWTIVTAVATVISAVATAVAALAAAFAAYYASGQLTDARRLAEVQALASLSKQGSDLYGQFSKNGIDDVPRLTAHLYLLYTYHNKGIVSDDIYVLEARSWCALTRGATQKLRANWDSSFRQAYSGQPAFLTLLDALTTPSPPGQKDCL